MLLNKAQILIETANKELGNPHLQLSERQAIREKLADNLLDFFKNLNVDDIPLEVKIKAFNSLFKSQVETIVDGIECVKTDDRFYIDEDHAHYATEDLNEMLFGSNFFDVYNPMVRIFGY